MPPLSRASDAPSGVDETVNGDQAVDVPPQQPARRYVTTPSGERILIIGRPQRGAASPPPSDSQPDAARVPRPGPLLPDRASAGLPAGAPALPAAEAHSEELQDLIAYAPNALVRWGTSAISATLIVLLALAWFIRYPIMVNGEAYLTAAVPPVRLVARTGGAIHRLFVGDGERVRAGADLALLESPTDYDDVRALSAKLDQLERVLDTSHLSPHLAFPQALTLGEIQDSYLVFLQRLSDYHSSDFGAFYDAKVASLRAEVNNLEQLQASLRRQQRILGDELALAGRQPIRDPNLVRRGVVSPAELNQVESRYLQQKLAAEGGLSAIGNNGAQLAARRGALLEVEQQRRDEARSRLLALQNAAAALRQAIAHWEQQYVVRAPVDGRVSFFRALVPKQFVAPAESLLAVVPSSDSAVGRVLLADANAGRVRVGQRVVMRFDSYPSAEFGTVSGRIERVSLLPNERRDEKDGTKMLHMLEVRFPNGLRTSYGQMLPLRYEMHGSASVITDNLRLLERITSRFRDLVTRAGGNRR